MINTITSPIEEVNAALLSHNPFSQPPFVNANNIWGKSFPDVESLNTHASDAVFQALSEIREGRYQTASILITAQNGTGKTHIVSRIRHRLQAQGGALFILANKFDNLNQPKQGFQQLIAESFSNIGSQGVKQWQELATAMANDVLKATNPNTQAWEPKNLVKKIEGSNEQQVTNWVSKLTKVFCKNKSAQDPDVIRAIFWTLSENEASFASNWLAGKELAQYKANELRLPSQSQSFDTVLKILAQISEYYELVICFDDLDLSDVNDAGLYKSQVVANLVKELFENLQRGVILSVMMPGIWTEKIKGELPASIAQKMTTYCSPLDLKYLDSDTTIEVVAFFLKEYYAIRELIPPHPIYPFEAGQLREIGREKPTVREVLQWCREHCKPDIPLVGLSQDETSPVELAFTSELSEDIKSRLDDNYFLADALFYSFQQLINHTVEQVTIKDVTVGVGKKGNRDDYLNFKIIGKENGKAVKIGVAVLQYDGGKGLGAGFKRLLDRERFGLSRGCLVRSGEKLINNYFQKTYIAPLINGGGEFIKLKGTEIKPLIAIRSVYQKRESEYKVTEEEILNFITDKGEKYWLGNHNPLIKEILSDPSYQIPNDIKGEPETLLDDDNDSDSDIAESEDLEELQIHD
ncbi:ATP-binding protein [Phormidium sp. CLA17]|uniref:AAA family ATPase n=1 Tax=Leptolyngbya sp. Cla-17 TaxID=2803751 RepID=UPI001490B6EF|nr:AAA family ATPase [Leptolyngbya sp. Cla-17]MBM0740598.1 ATP-binding protein [Leptolyngbya sp. Cla-17]